jgi:hypothetical protein
VSTDWLYEFGAPLLEFSDPLELPQPRYNLEKDTVTCFVEVYFGPHHWELPRHEIDMEYGVEKLKWFAMFFLEGQVFPKLKAFQVCFFRSLSFLLFIYLFHSYFSFFLCANFFLLAGLFEVFSEVNYQAVGTRQDGFYCPAADFLSH